MLRLLPVLLPRHRYSRPGPVEGSVSPPGDRAIDPAIDLAMSPSAAEPLVGLEAPAAWPVELSLIAVETMIDTVRLRIPEPSRAAMLPSMRATMRLRAHAQRERARELGLDPARAPRASVQHASLIPLLVPQVVQAIQRRRHGPGYSFSPGWRGVLAGKLLGELDRRRSWRLAGGSNLSYPSNSALSPPLRGDVQLFPDQRSIS